MMFNTTKVLQNLILFGLITMPIFTFTEVNALMYSSSRHHSQLLTPFYIKALKDLIFISIILISFFSEIIKKNTIKINYYIIILFFLICFSISISLINNDIKAIFSGIRWLLPILLILSLVNRIDEYFLVKIAKTLKVLVLIGLFFQLNQLYTLDNYFGPNQFGFSKRNPGFFSIPSTMSMFLLFSMWFAYNFLDKTRFNKLYIYCILPFCIFLAGSATGLLILFLFYATIIFKKVKQKDIVFISSSLLSLLFILTLPLITNRDGVFQSLTLRLFKFSNLNLSDLLIGDSFGLATNTAILLRVPNALAADSLILSIILNCGFLFLLVFVTWIIAKSKKSFEFVQFLILVSIFSFNSIIFEVYPANLLFAVCIAYFITINKEKKIF
jgi:hypothetical protein